MPRKRRTRLQHDFVTPLRIVQRRWRLSPARTVPLAAGDNWIRHCKKRRHRRKRDRTGGDEVGRGGVRRRRGSGQFLSCVRTGHKDKQQECGTRDWSEHVRGKYFFTEPTSNNR